MLVNGTYQLPDDLIESTWTPMAFARMNDQPGRWTNRLDERSGVGHRHHRVDGAGMDEGRDLDAAGGDLVICRQLLQLASGASPRTAAQDSMRLAPDRIRPVVDITGKLKWCSNRMEACDMRRRRRPVGDAPTQTRSKYVDSSRIDPRHIRQPLDHVDAHPRRLNRQRPLARAPPGHVNPAHGDPGCKQRIGNVIEILDDHPDAREDRDHREQAVSRSQH